MFGGEWGRGPAQVGGLQLSCCSVHQGAGPAQHNPQISTSTAWTHLGDSSGHPVQYNPVVSMTLRHQHGLKWLTISLALAQLSMVSGAMDVNTDTGHDRSKDPDMALGRSPGPDNTMVLASSASHSDQHGPRTSMALRHQHGQRFQFRPQTSEWPLEATWATDPSCGRTRNPDMAIGSSPGPVIH